MKNIHRIKLLVLICALPFVIWGCANKLNIEGGPADETAPLLDAEKSDNNFQTNFTGREFQLSFNEFVNLQKPGEQIVVSPPLRYALQPVQRGKKVLFRLHPDEELLENTTYTIQFGESVQDITEGNAVEDLRFVFSTGDIIDSMIVAVRVRDLMTKEPVNGALVMLYETLSDTVIRSGRPLYFSKTDSSGLAIVRNTRPSEYRVIALLDENRNYQLDLAEEQIAYIDTFVRSVAQTSTPFVLDMFREIDPPVRLDVVRMDSLTYIFTLAGETDYAEWRSVPEVDYTIFQDKDTTFIQFEEPANFMILSSPYADPDTIKFDNVSLKPKRKIRFDELNILSNQPKLENGKININIKWNNPIQAVDKSKFMGFDQDSVLMNLPELFIDSTSIGTTRLNLSWNAKGMQDSLLMLSGAVTSWYTENDTIVLSLRPSKVESLSNLTVMISELNPELNYIVRIIDASGEIVRERQVTDEASLEWKVSGLFPKKHLLELITDLNNNGRRDGGWFDLRQIPEPMIAKEISDLRPNWDVEIEIKTKD